MTDFPSIAPSFEQMRHWDTLVFDGEEDLDVVLVQAFQAGADQELEACLEEIKRLEWFCEPTLRLNELHAARRPKPPGLKAQAIATLKEMEVKPCIRNGKDLNAALRAKYDIILSALEVLPND